MVSLLDAVADAHVSVPAKVSRVCDDVVRMITDERVSGSSTGDLRIAQAPSPLTRSEGGMNDTSLTSFVPSGGQ